MTVASAELVYAKHPTVLHNSYDDEKYIANNILES